MEHTQLLFIKQLLIVQWNFSVYAQYLATNSLPEVHSKNTKITS